MVSCKSIGLYMSRFNDLLVLVSVGVSLHNAAQIVLTFRTALLCSSLQHHCIRKYSAPPSTLGLLHRICLCCMSEVSGFQESGSRPHSFIHSFWNRTVCMYLGAKTLDRGKNLQLEFWRLFGLVLLRQYPDLVRFHHSNRKKKKNHWCRILQSWHLSENHRTFCVFCDWRNFWLHTLWSSLLTHTAPP